MSYKVFITIQLTDQAMNILKAESDKLSIKSWNTESVIPREKLLENVVGVNGIICTICDEIDTELLDAAGPQLKIISTMSAGETHINLTECKKRGIEVCKVQDVASDCAAEFAVTLVMLVARRLLEGMDAVANGEWGLWKPMWICGFEMNGRTLGIVGFGRVGFGIARRLKPFNIKQILYYDTYDKEFAPSVHAKRMNSLSELVAESDIVCICCAVNATTIKSFNKSIFAKMKEGSILINTARGVIVDHDDLDAALKAGRPMAAALDVTDPEPLPMSHPLMSNPKCIITPHLGTATLTTRHNMMREAAINLHVSLLGYRPDLPEQTGRPSSGKGTTKKVMSSCFR